MSEISKLFSKCFGPDGVDFDRKNIFINSKGPLQETLVRNRYVIWLFQRMILSGIFVWLLILWSFPLPLISSGLLVVWLPFIKPSCTCLCLEHYMQVLFYVDHSRIVLFALGACLFPFLSWVVLMASRQILAVADWMQIDLFERLRASHMVNFVKHMWHAEFGWNI